MGLKSKLSKMKNFLFDEEDNDKVDKKKNKKKVEIEQEIEVRKEETNDRFDDFYFDDVSDKEIEDTTQVKSRMTKENEFKFPEFNDEDFMSSVPEKKEEVPVIKKEEARPLLYQGSKRREETKKFKPSPIISPIYGLLDDNGEKTKQDAKKEELPAKASGDPTFDEIRKKAYGMIDNEFENTLSKLNQKTIEETEKDLEKSEEAEVKVDEIPSRTETKNKILYEQDLAIDTNDESDDDMVLPDVNFKEIDIDKERNKKSGINVDKSEEDDDEDTKEQDLFNLIDTMYSGEEKDKL